MATIDQEPGTIMQTSAEWAAQCKAARIAGLTWPVWARGVLNAEAEAFLKSADEPTAEP